MSDSVQDLHVGVVGFGYWGPNIVRNLAGTPGIHPVIVADHDESRLAKARALYPQIETTRDVHGVLGNDSVDAVAIVTPVSTHYSIAKQALETGKHVLLEKPMTASVAEAEDLVRIARERKLCLMVDHTFLYNGAIRAIRDLIASGELGEILYYDSTRINLGLYQNDVSVIWDLRRTTSRSWTISSGKPRGTSPPSDRDSAASRPAWPLWLPSSRMPASPISISTGCRPSRCAG